MSISLILHHPWVWSSAMTPDIYCVAQKKKDRYRSTLTIFHALSAGTALLSLCNQLQHLMWSSLKTNTRTSSSPCRLEFSRPCQRFSTQPTHIHSSSISLASKEKEKHTRITIRRRKPIPENVAVIIAVRWKFKWELKDAPSSYNVFIPPGVVSLLLRWCRP